MAAALPRSKKWVYYIAASVAIILLIIRGINAVRRNDYDTQEIVNMGKDAQVSVSYPKKILSSKSEALYPLAITFTGLAHPNPADEYEFVFDSPSLVFTDNAGKDVEPRLKISSDSAFLQKRIFIRPSPSETYLNSHKIWIRVFKNGQLLTPVSEQITFDVESKFFSYFSLIASSILEISIVLGLATLVTKALDDEQTARRQLMDKRRAEVQKLSSLPLLARMRYCLDLQNRQSKERWDDDLKREFAAQKSSFSEKDFFQAVGASLISDQGENLQDIQILHDEFLGNGKAAPSHPDAMRVLSQLLDGKPNSNIPVSNLKSLLELWDRYDADVKELMVGLAKYLPPTGMQNASQNQRRLLRSLEFRHFFSQPPPPPGYDAAWRHSTNVDGKSVVINWLRLHGLESNPFGADDIRLLHFYPPGSARPDNWELFVAPEPMFGCAEKDDVRALGHLMMEECLPSKKDDGFTKTERRIFPIAVALERDGNLCEPLVTLCNAAAQSWLEILPFNPDALLDLPIPDQNNLLELLIWAMGSQGAILSQLYQNGLVDNPAGNLLKRKVSEFVGRGPVGYQPLDHIMFSWLKLRPPDLEKTYLILTHDNFLGLEESLWLERFGPLITHLYLNGIIVKFIAFVQPPASLPLPVTILNWSETRLRLSIDSQFNAVMDKRDKEEMGIVVRFHDLFGPGADEEYTTRLIRASKNSLATLLILGRRILENHCKARPEEDLKSDHKEYLFPEELNDILSGP